MLFAVLYLLYV